MDGLWIDFPYSQYQMGILARPQWFRPRCLYIADGSEPKHLLCTGSRREVMISQTKTTAVNAHTLAHTWVFWDPMIKTHVDFAAWCNSLMISTECITGVGIDCEVNHLHLREKTKLNNNCQHISPTIAKICTNSNALCLTPICHLCWALPCRHRPHKLQNPRCCHNAHAALLSFSDDRTQ